MQKFDQKVIILFGTYNSGKTIIYNLFKKEENYKYLDINPEHIQFDDIKKQLDLKSWNRLKVILKNNRIKEYEVFEKYGYMSQIIGVHTDSKLKYYKKAEVDVEYTI